MPSQSWLGVRSSLKVPSKVITIFIGSESKSHFTVSYRAGHIVHQRKLYHCEHSFPNDSPDFYKVL